MSTKNGINSHVFIPKSILNRFAVRDEKNNIIVKYIDLNDMKIKSARTASFNTQIGYYAQNNEKILDQESESRIGSVIVKLLKLNEGDELNKKEINALYKFLAYQILRTDYFSEQLKEKLRINIKNKDIKNIMIKEEKELNIVYGVIKKLDIYIIVNKTENKFIMPINTMYTFNGESENDYIWIQILSPDIAIVFMPEGKINEISNGKIESKVQILQFREEQNEVIDGFNIRAIGAQCKEKIKMKYIIGRQKELEKYLKIVNK